MGRTRQARRTCTVIPGEVNIRLIIQLEEHLNKARPPPMLQCTPCTAPPNAHKIRWLVVCTYDCKNSSLSLRTQSGVRLGHRPYQISYIVRKDPRRTSTITAAVALDEPEQANLVRLLRTMPAIHR